MIMITRNKFRIFISDQLVYKGLSASLSPTGIASTYGYNTHPYSLLMECALGFRLKTKTVSLHCFDYNTQHSVVRLVHNTLCIQCCFVLKDCGRMYTEEVRYCNTSCSYIDAVSASWNVRM